MYGGGGVDGGRRVQDGRVSQVGVSCGIKLGNPSAPPSGMPSPGHPGTPETIISLISFIIGPEMLCCQHPHAFEASLLSCGQHDTRVHDIFASDAEPIDMLSFHLPQDLLSPASNGNGGNNYNDVLQSLLAGLTHRPQQEHDGGELQSDDFKMYRFKVEMCSKKFVHDWRTCPFRYVDLRRSLCRFGFNPRSLALTWVFPPLFPFQSSDRERPQARSENL